VIAGQNLDAESLGLRLEIFDGYLGRFDRARPGDVGVEPGLVVEHANPEHG
jgi:hypothetical protein